MEPELIADYQDECGENPLWHPLEKSSTGWTLTGADIPFRSADGKSEMVYEDIPVGGFTISKTAHCCFSAPEARSSSGAMVKPPCDQGNPRGTQAALQ